jgi:hypothetical protein
MMTQCSTCNKSLLYCIHNKDNSLPSIAHGRGDFFLMEDWLVWPSPGYFHVAVPATIQKIYAEASLIKGRAPNAFANQIRRCLEAVCIDRGATKRILADNLKELADRGEIPQTLADMADVLRTLGNIGSHFDDEEVSPEYVPVIDDFFRAVVEYVYIAPHKVKEFKDRLDQAKKATAK